MCFSIQNTFCNRFCVVKKCKDHLKMTPKELQGSILSDIQYLHLSTSEGDFPEREVTILQKLYQSAPDCVRYFNSQWNADNSFSNWNIFCSKPGKCIFNSRRNYYMKLIFQFDIKCFFTKHVLILIFTQVLPQQIMLLSHSIMLWRELYIWRDLILEYIAIYVSLDVESQRKCYEVWCKPDISVCRSARAITLDCYKTEQIKQGIVMYTKLEINDSYVVNYLGDICTCWYFIKHAYCKHLFHAHEVINNESSKIIIDRRFSYKGNTRRAYRERGHARTIKVQVLMAGKVEKRWSKRVSAEKEDMVGTVVELPPIDLLGCREAHWQPHEAYPQFL